MADNHIKLKDIALNVDNLTVNTEKDGYIAVSAPTYTRITMLSGTDEDNSRSEATFTQEDYNGPLHIESSGKQVHIEGDATIKGRLNIKDPVRMVDQDTGEEYELAIYNGQMKIHKVDK